MVIKTFDSKNISRGFSDEIFRVFKNKHPNTELSPINMSPDVKFMIKRVKIKNKKKTKKLRAKHGV